MPSAIKSHTQLRPDIYMKQWTKLSFFWCLHLHSYAVSYFGLEKRLILLVNIAWSIMQCTSLCACNAGGCGGVCDAGGCGGACDAGGCGGACDAGGCGGACDAGGCSGKGSASHAPPNALTIDTCS